MTGSFAQNEAIDLLTRIIFIQIRFHESKINAFAGNDDIVHHRKCVDNLQQSLFAIRQLIERSPGKIDLNSKLIISQTPISHDE